MEYRTLGRTGLKVSPLCLGCMSFRDPSRGNHSWILNEEQSLPFYRDAIETGINFFDTSNFYSISASEEMLGKCRENTPGVKKPWLPPKPASIWKQTRTGSAWAWRFVQMRTFQKANGLATFVAMQNFYNLCYREEKRGMIPYCKAEGVALVPWSPIARDFLVGNK